MHCSRTAKKLFNGIWLAAVLAASAQAREVVDATGVHVGIPPEPRRIVTLVPSLGELVADFVGDHLERIAGVAEYTDYPPALKKFPSIGRYDRFNLEKVAALKPDLILATEDGNPKDEVLHLREMGYPVVVVAGDSFARVQESMLLVAQAIGAENLGRKMAAQFQAGLARIAQRAKLHSPTKVLLQLGADPLITVGSHTFLQEALAAVGAVNSYGNSSAHYPRPGLEDVLYRDPDAIIVLALGDDLEPFRQMARKWSEFPKLKAVRAKRVRVLQGDAIVRPSLRLLEGLSQLEKAIYE